ncbi:MAG TPA: hypothetical protein VK901_03080 [Nitrospiraceae bacterium]|nr:hypothetical protein [Nitrospiraceae bacterium]
MATTTASLYNCGSDASAGTPTSPGGDNASGFSSDVMYRARQENPPPLLQSAHPLEQFGVCQWLRTTFNTVCVPIPKSSSRHGTVPVLCVAWPTLIGGSWHVPNRRCHLPNRYLGAISSTLEKPL